MPTDSLAPFPTDSEPQLDALASDYRRGNLNRREFLTRVIALTGSMAAAHLALEKSGLAQVVSEKEAQTAKITASDVIYPSGQTAEAGDAIPEIKTGGYLCVPQGNGPFPAVLVIHENRGLNEHTRDVARRFAGEGFVALAPDALARLGGTSAMKTPDEARTAIGTISPADALADLEAGLAYLDTLASVRRGKLASVGFCWGGSRSFALAAQSERLRAAVVFYGSAPPNDQIALVKCPVLGLYGETDERITSQVPAVAEAMKAAGKSFDSKIYTGAGHAFFNDTGERYNAEAATDAWTRTLTFLRAQLV